MNKKQKLLIVAIVVLGILGMAGYLLNRQLTQNQTATNTQTSINTPTELVDCSGGKIVEGDFIKSVADDNLKKVMADTLFNSLKDGNWLDSDPYCNDPSAQIKVAGAKADLNNDGRLEYVVFPEEYFDKKLGKQFVRGASANGPILVFGILNDEWADIGSMDGNSIGKVKDRRSEGYVNLVTYGHNSAISGVFREYAWDGGRYKFIKETNIDDRYPKFKTTFPNL